MLHLLLAGMIGLDTALKRSLGQKTQRIRTSLTNPRIEEGDHDADVHVRLAKVVEAIEILDQLEDLMSKRVACSRVHFTK